MYDRPAKKLTKLCSRRGPSSKARNSASMHPVEIKARDGLDARRLLTLPAGSDPDGDGKPDAPLPMVLNVHGGPWARDSWGFDPEHQWLANRGYAVLAVNFRGSTGFGKEFMNAGDLEWGRKMHDDLIDAVDWAVQGRHRAAGQGRDLSAAATAATRRSRAHDDAGRVRLRRRHRRSVESR